MAIEGAAAFGRRNVASARSAPAPAKRFAPPRPAKAGPGTLLTAGVGMLALTSAIIFQGMRYDSERRKAEAARMETHAAASAPGGGCLNAALTGSETAAALCAR